MIFRKKDYVSKYDFTCNLKEICGMGSVVHFSFKYVPKNAMFNPYAADG